MSYVKRHIKKNFSTLLIFTVLYVNIFVCFGQFEAVIGNGTTTNTGTSYPAPYGQWYYGAKHQFSITASELSNAGIPAGALIGEFSFYVDVDNAVSHNNFQLGVYQSSVPNPIANGFYQNASGSFSNTVNYDPVTGWNEHTVSPFVWDGVSDLVIETCFNNSNYTTNARTRWTTNLTGTDVKSRWYRADNTSVCGSLATTGTSTTTRPNIKIGYNAGPKTYVPDDNFEAYLEANGMGDGIPFNDSVYTSSITDVQNLTVSGLSIADLTGIVDFASLEILFCDSNELTNLNLINNTALIQVYCSENQLANLEVAGLNNLEILNCSFNQLQIIDFSGLSNLQVFDCSQNLLTSLDVSNLNLTDLNCSDNLLSTINVDGLYCELTFNCSNNVLTSIDFSNSYASDFYAFGNQLTNLDIRNGLNTSMWGFDVISNPDLYCIAVDDASWSYANWGGIDPHMSFGEDCNAKTYVPDDNFESYLETHDQMSISVSLGDMTSMGDGIANNDSVYTYRIESAPDLFISSLGISDLTGIEDFSSLGTLDCGFNALSNIDLSSNFLLVYLVCNSNMLTSLDVSNNLDLYWLNCEMNLISSLNLSNNNALQELDCSFNQLTSLNLDLNSSLSDLFCSFNQLTTLDLSSNLNLQSISCGDNQLTYLDLRNGNNTNCIYSSFNNPDLTCVLVDDPAWSTSDWTNRDTHTFFSGQTPVVDAGIDQMVCSGDSVLLSGNGNASSYNWNNSESNNTLFTELPGIYEIELTGTMEYGCSDKDTVFIEFLELPSVNAGDDQAFCEGNSSILGGSGAETYSWDSGITDGVSFIPSSGTHAYTVIGTDDNGCSTSDTVVLTVYELPNVFAGLDFNYCPEDSIILVGSGAINYLWSNGITDGFPFVPSSDTMTFTLTGTDENGCSAMDDVSITKLEQIIAPIDTVVCSGEEVNLYVSNNYLGESNAYNGPSWHVSNCGSDATGDGSRNNPFQSITHAVDIAQTADTIYIDSGVFFENIFIDKSLNLIGSGMFETIIDANNNAPGINAESVNIDIHIEGLAVRNASSVSGAITIITGNQTTSMSQITINNCRLFENSCSGIVIIDEGSGSAILKNNLIANNSVSGFNMTSTTSNMSVLFQNNTIVNNDGGTSVNVGGPYEFILKNNIIVGGSQTFFGAKGASEAYNNCIWNVALPYKFNPAVLSNDIYVDPELSMGPDYTLLVSSPCIDNGIEDIDGDANNYLTDVDDQDPDGTRMDIGYAHYAQGPIVNPSNETVVPDISCNYSSLWSNGVTNSMITVSPTETTTYYVSTYFENEGCTLVDSSTVYVNPLPQVNAGSDGSFCEGNATILNGSGAETYSWDNGITDGVSFIPPSGTETYTLTGTDSNGCINSDEVVLTVYELPNVFAGNNQEVCDNGDLITVIASGAETYQWTNGITDGVGFLPNLGTTTYSVTGTDANGCENTDDVSVLVNPLPALEAGQDQTFCEGTTTVVNGSGATSYAWDNGISNGIDFVPPVGTNIYSVVGTDINGCQNSDQLTITVNALPPVNAGTDVSFCIGNSATLSGSGANTYEWDNGINDGDSFIPPSGTELYTVTGTDSNGCSNTDEMVLTVYELPNVFAGSDQEVCDGETIVLKGVGIPMNDGHCATSGGTSYAQGITNFSFNGDGDDIDNTSTANGGGQDYTSSIVATASQGSTALLNVSLATAGSYEYAAKIYIDWNRDDDFNDIGEEYYMGTNTGGGICSNTNVAVSIPGDASGYYKMRAISRWVSESTVDPCAASGFDGEREDYKLRVTGGISYSWNNGVIDGVSFLPNLGTTTYSVTGTDANGCENTDDVSVLVNPLPAVEAGQDQTFCEGTATVVNGSGATSYAWDNGVNNSIDFVPPVGTNIYSVVGTDINGCQNSDQLTITINALPPVNAGSDDSFCIGISATLSGSGAETYSWDNGITDGVSFIPPSGTETYTLTGTDSNGCINSDEVVLTVYELPNVFAGSDQELCDYGDLLTLSATGAETYQWTNGITDGVGFFPSLGTTNYTVTGTDNNGCVNTDELTILVNPLPIVEAGPNQTFCEGNATALSASGATTYFWDNGVNDGIAFIPIVGSTTYTVVGTDVNGCQNTDELTILVNPLPNVFAGSDLTLCEGESALLSGSGAMDYDWSGGVADGNSFIPNTGTNLYQVVGTDDNGCSNSDEISVVVNPLPIVSAGPNQSLCIGNTIVLVGSGASSYEWNNGVTDLIPFQPGVGSENYTLIGTDGNGCQNTDQVNVTVFALPNVNAGIDQELCEGASTALQAVGAVSYAWDNNAMNGASFVPDIGTSQYTVTGTDMNGCVNTDEMLITVYALPDVFAGTNQQLCNGESTFVNATGAVNYQWNNGVTNWSQFTPPQGTTVYTVEGTDANGCSNTDQLSIEVNAIPIIDAGSNQSICDGNSVILFASGTGTLIWSQGVSNGVPFVPPLGFNTYNVSVVDVNGCFNTDEVSVSVNPIPTVYAGVDIEICEEEPVTLNASGAQSYAWSGGVVNNIAFVPSVGNYVYTVTGTTDEGCSASDQVEVVVNSFTYGVDSHTACDAFVWMDGIEYTQSNNSATYILTNSNGCDSIVTLNLTMSYQSDTTLFVSSLGDYSLNGQVYSESGTYVQQIQNQYGCDSTIYLQLNITQSGIDKLTALGIRAYPNPFSSILHLDFEQLIPEQRLVLTDINGKVLLQRNNLQLNNVIQLNDLESGMYYLNLFQKDRPIGQLKVIRY